MDDPEGRKTCPSSLAGQPRLSLRKRRSCEQDDGTASHHVTGEACESCEGCDMSGGERF